MTPEARKALPGTIRALRARLLDDLHDATSSAYRLGVRARDAGLSAAAAARRRRLEAALDEAARAEPGRRARSADEHRSEIEKQAAFTLLNRLVVLRLMEAPGPDGAPPLRAPAVVTGGWESRGFQDFRSLAPGLVHGDLTEGYGLLLQLIYEDLARDLPGIFGPNGAADLIPVPPATLRHLIEALDHPDLRTCWTDDMTLGWVYQYWNDPEREALDVKLAGGGKLAPHEIASKTQMFTERYMVDWTLQNTLGPMWLAICHNHGWIPDVVRDGTLDALEARRADWRARREAGQVGLTELMPLHTPTERRWAYTLPQPLPPDAAPPDSVRDLRLLDPAMGSGHFLVIALDLLYALYQEEARHRGEAHLPRWSPRAAVERILSHNLHGLDLDPRAVQIAAAALWLKARALAPDARPPALNLVASRLSLASLPEDDPALAALKAELSRETGLPGALTTRLIDALRGADHLGSLLRVDATVEDALDAHDEALGRLQPEQGDLFGAWKARPERVPIARDDARATVLDRLEGFLARHTAGDDLGLRTYGAQLAAGVRFVRLLREGTYDLVVGNPPYQGTSKMADTAYIQKMYPRGKADLYAAFLERGLQLVRPGGVSALLTMRNWMFIKQYTELRRWLLEGFHLYGLCDLSWGAFEEMRDNPVAISIWRKAPPAELSSVAVAPTDPQIRVRTIDELHRKRAALLCGVGKIEFKGEALKVVPEWPLVYWWSPEFLTWYNATPCVKDYAPIRQGLATSNNQRHLRRPWEIEGKSWVPHIMGTNGKRWIEPLDVVINWINNGLCLKAFHEMQYVSYTKRIPSEDFFFRKGLAFTTIGSDFSVRIHRFPGTIDTTGCSLYPSDLPSVLCSMNSQRAAGILSALNPTVHFTNGDVNRLPLFPIANADEIYATLEAAFTTHESHREPSVEFRAPGPSPWRHAQDWAQQAVDRPEGAPLPDYHPQLDPAPAWHALSYALGVALGRFAADGGGVLDPATADLSGALPAGLLYLDGTLQPGEASDDLGHPAALPLHAAWAAQVAHLDTKRAGLRDWLRLDFFGLHRAMYENRPIHWPLSSADRTFVLWVSIHRLGPRTLTEGLARLQDTATRLDGELHDLRAARDGADKKAAREAEKRLSRVLRWRDELQAFRAALEACAEQGPPPPDPRCPPRDADARYAPDLDDGVMINSAALWPLLDPQWKDPRKWWGELAQAQGRKDYDWSHLAARYWPDRVRQKCRQDPSLAVAHGTCWRDHPARAWAWELRLQHEIAPDFRIQEVDADASRAAWLANHPQEALDAVGREAQRRLRRATAPLPGLTLLDPGLWTAIPEEVWVLELDLSARQGAEWRLSAPDEPAARAAHEAQHPATAADRRRWLATLTPRALFPEDEDAAPADDGPEEDGEDG